MNSEEQEFKNQLREYVSEHYSLNSQEQEELVDELFQEKYLDVATISPCSEDNDNEDFVDIAYENMMARENYVVSLISSHSGIGTSRDKWEYNLDYLQTHYDELMSLTNVNNLHVDRYIEDYEALQISNSRQTSETKNTKTTRTSSYTYTSAVNYANQYYSSYNSAYPDWSSYGGDCANFVSQCLYAGGKSMQGTPGTSTASNNLSNWFSTGSTCNTNNVSSTWRGANYFKTYWQANATDDETFSSVGDDSYVFGCAGDAVSLLNEYGNAYHTLIIVGYKFSTRDFIVAAHTGNTNTKTLSSYNPVGGFTIYNMR